MSDVYLDDCVAQLDRLATDPTTFSRAHGLLLLKPDAVVARRLLPAIDWLSHHGFRIVAAERISLDRHAIRAVWQAPWQAATWQRRRLADLLATATDSLVLLVRTEAGPAPVCVRLTGMKGASDPHLREPGQLRHALGSHSFLLNMAHTADEPADVLRELAVYFDTEDLHRVLRDTLTDTDRATRAKQLASELYARFPPQCLGLAEHTAALLQELNGLLVGGAVSSAARACLRDTVGPQNGNLRAVLAELVHWAWQQGIRLDPWNVIVVGAAVLPMSIPAVDPRRGVPCTS